MMQSKCRKDKMVAASVYWDYQLTDEEIKELHERPIFIPVSGELLKKLSVEV